MVSTLDRFIDLHFSLRFSPCTVNFKYSSQLSEIAERSAKSDSSPRYLPRIVHIYIFVDRLFHNQCVPATLTPDSECYNIDPDVHLDHTGKR